MSGVLRVLFPLFLSIPIVIFGLDEFEVPLSDIVLLFGMLFLLRSLASKAALYFYLLFLLALLSVVVQMIFGAPVEVKPFLSVLFFLKPLLAYFAALWVVKGPADGETVFRITGLSMITSIILIFLDVVINYSGVPRADSYINGSILGLTQYATYGVNTAACFYFVIFTLSVYTFCNPVNAQFLRLYGVIGAVCSGYLIIGSLSREVILALLLFVFLIVFEKQRKNRWLIFFGIVFVVVVCGLFLLEDIVNSPFLEAKVLQLVDGYHSGDFNSISSGRLELYWVALLQVLQGPFFGNGFHGYLLYPEIISFDLEPEGLSPHNQYLTTFWKGGLIFFIAYFSYLYMLIRDSRILAEPVGGGYVLRAFYISTFILLANLWDVLMVANFGAMFFFLIGVVHAMWVKRI